MTRYFPSLFLLALGTAVTAGNRDTLVHQDRRDTKATGRWVYNDLAQGIQQAGRTQKPMLVIFR